MTALPFSRLRSIAAGQRVTRMLVVMGLLILIVRVSAIFLLPNHDGDAYCYLEKAAELRGALLAGTFRPSDLFYFWLPLYPLLVALASILLPGIGVMLAGKLVSAAAGLGACLLVYRLLIVLTGRALVAGTGASLVAFDPWQVLYSTNTMTEMLFEALVLGALERTVHRRWTAAAALLAAAGFIRIEAWSLAALVPLAAFLVDGRPGIVPVTAIFLPPGLWAAVNLAAMGDAFAFFRIRQGYVAAYLTANGTRRHFDGGNFMADWDNLSRGANLAFLAGACLAIGRLSAGLLSRRGRTAAPAATWAALAVGIVYGGLCAFLAAAYLTRSQPVLWTRYGLIYQPLGVCLTLWWITHLSRPRWRWFAMAALGWHLCTHTLNEGRAVRAAGDNFAWHRLAAARLAAMAPACVYCDSPVIRVESGLPRTSLRDRYQLRGDEAGFLEDMRRHGVGCLVFVPLEDSTPAKLFPELRGFQRTHGFEPLERFAPDPADWRLPVLIYRYAPAGGTRAAVEISP